MKLFNNIGVYTITNLINNKIYVGSTLISFKQRWAQHVSSLKYNKHNNRYLQSSWNKHGEKNFKFEVLEEYSLEIIIDMENYWINMLNTRNPEFGYNLNSPKVGNYGIKFSKEIRERMGKAQLGRKHSEISKIKMSKSRIGLFAGSKNPMFGRKLSSFNKQKIQEVKCIKVEKCDLSGNVLEVFSSIKAAYINSKCKSLSNFARYLNKKNPIYNGNLWRKIK